MTRKQAREQAFILLFEYSFTLDSAEELFAVAAEAGVEEQDEYCVKVVTDAIDNILEIDETISKYLKGWSTSRISRVALAALRLAIAEIRFFDDTAKLLGCLPGKVARFCVNSFYPTLRNLKHKLR